MSKTIDAAGVFDREFLELRAGLLQIAAQLDRVDRAAELGAGKAAIDPRMQGIQRALKVLAGDQSGRAEKVQLVFSRQYEPDWKQKVLIGEA